ncbi:hypothetical protein E2562_028427 [Oryza meyeriana var. granulata]|uniref:Uncharacterized protein n=1 Tax=Oryza meyeriana var. granulata TaxID=110450 RepID=A0A6G1EQP3_9ORYZ|nr:hypothetical protein E2562_028427 [Oryza meyeriana var. granulata]
MVFKAVDRSSSFFFTKGFFGPAGFGDFLHGHDFAEYLHDRYLSACTLRRKQFHKRFPCFYPQSAHPAIGKEDVAQLLNKILGQDCRDAYCYFCKNLHGVSLKLRGTYDLAIKDPQQVADCVLAR